MEGRRQRYFYAAVGVGQLLSLLIAASATFAEKLSNEEVYFPTLQSSLNYLLLAVVYGGWLLHKGTRTLRGKLWAYALLGLLDVEANYCLVKAYQYTSLTSVTLLDCFAIPGVLLLTYLFLNAQYKFGHFLGAAVCIMGVAVLVGTDAVQMPGAADVNPALGDCLVLLGASLYAICNVLQEKILGDASMTEVLAMLGACGFGWSTIQVLATELPALLHADWGNMAVGKTVGYFVGFNGALFSFYSLVPGVLRFGGAAVLNMSLLTSDLWAAASRVLFFGGFPGFSGVFFAVSLVLVAAGLAVYTLSGDVYTTAGAKGSLERGYSAIQDELDATLGLEEGYMDDLPKRANGMNGSGGSNGKKRDMSEPYKPIYKQGGPRAMRFTKGQSTKFKEKLLHIVSGSSGGLDGITPEAAGLPMLEPLQRSGVSLAYRQQGQQALSGTLSADALLEVVDAATAARARTNELTLVTIASNNPTDLAVAAAAVSGEGGLQKAPSLTAATMYSIEEGTEGSPRGSGSSWRTPGSSSRSLESRGSLRAREEVEAYPAMGSAVASPRSAYTSPRDERVVAGPPEFHGASAISNGSSYPPSQRYRALDANVLQPWELEKINRGASASQEELEEASLLPDSGRRRGR